MRNLFFRYRVWSLLTVSFLLTSAHTFAQTVRLNEVLAGNSSVQTANGAFSDYVELVNTSGATADLSGASLSDDPSLPRKWVFPAGTTVPANGYLVVLLDSGSAPSTSGGGALNTGFGVNDRGDQVYLYSAPGAGGLLLDAVTFGVQVRDLSIGRVNDAWVLTNPSPGANNTPVALAAPTSLRVNEFLADPSGGDDWLEIVNLANAPVAIGNFSLTDKPADEPRLSPIQLLSFIGSGDDAYIRFWASDDVAEGADHLAFKLGAGGDTIAIFNSTGALIDSLTFGQQQEDISQGRLPNGTGGLVSFPESSSPGEPNYTIFAGIVVSEVLTHTDPPQEDAVEFYNVTGSPIDISGWYLSNKRSEPMRYRMPANSIVPAGGYLVVYEYQFGGQANGSTTLVPFRFDSAQGDQVYLFPTDAGGALTGTRVEMDFDAAAPGVSFGRFATSVPGDVKFVALNETTLGQDDATDLGTFRQGRGETNAYPRVGPIVISEIMYHPPDIGTNDNILDEYVELQNISYEDVVFSYPGTTNPWRLQGGVDFNFAPNFTIPAGGFAIVVSFNPNVDTAQAAAFRSKYSVPFSVPLVGPYDGKLSNSGDDVELYRPDAAQQPPSSDAGFVPYIRVDKVNYSDQAPTAWPTGADASGLSLNRQSAYLFGNDAGNWVAAAPTPGRANNTVEADSDQDGMTDRFESAYQLNPRNAADAGLDPDSDGLTNLQEANAGSNPRHAGGQLRIEIVMAEGGVPHIRFTAQAGVTYAVQYKNELDQATWQTLQTVPAQAQTQTVDVTDPAPHTESRFYRVVTPAP